VKITEAPVTRRGSEIEKEEGRRSAAQIDDTVSMMRENIAKVSERGERLDALQGKTDNLSISAAGFRRTRGEKAVYSTVWESLPSPTAAITSIQE